MAKKAPEKTKKPQNSSTENSFKAIFEDKSTVSVVVATLILLMLSFFAFRYFGSSNNANDNINGEGASDIVVSNDKSGGETQTEQTDENGQVASAETEQAVVQEQKPTQQVTPTATSNPTPTPTPTVNEEQTESSQEAAEEGDTEEMSNDSNTDQNKDEEQSGDNQEQSDEQDQKGLRGFMSKLFSNKKDQQDQNAQDQNEEQITDNEQTEDDSQVLGTGGADSYYDASSWKANDYDANSKTGDTYTVQSGDTLWEIAEAFYGNGADWVKIAQANNVGYLANGAPLIHSGNVLTIPN